MIAGVIPNRMRAAVFVGAGTPLEIRDFPRPDLAAGEVLVRVACCNLCGSDLHTYLGRRPTAAPTVLGHEIVGEVAEVGPGEAARDLAGRVLEIGDRISWSVAAHCGQCYFCRNGLPQKCEKLFKYGHESCSNGHPLSGGLAEFCHLAAGTPILRIPEQVPDVVAASANCATATVAAAFRAAGGCHGRSVLIQGAGLLGLTTAAMACVGRAEQIVVVDLDRDRLKLAARFGATAAVDLSKSPTGPNTAVMEHTAGRGFDVAFEMSGAPAAIEQGVGLLRIGGQYVLVGSVSPSRPVAIDAEQIVRRMLTLQGIHNYAPQDLVAAIDFLVNHHATFPFEELIGGHFSLDNAEAAFQQSARGGAVRIAVRPQQSPLGKELSPRRRRIFARPDNDSRGAANRGRRSNLSQ